MKKKIKIAVLMGGKSSEHDISVLSGKEVIKNIDRKKYDVSSIVISKLGKGIEKIFDSNADVFFIALHGSFGEDGTIQGLLELIRKPYTGSGVLASALGINKEMFKKAMFAENIKTPISTNKFPCFVKPYNQGSSVGASIVKNKKELNKALKLANKYSDKILIEEYLVGKELTCSVIGNEKPIALPIVEIIPLKGEFFNYKSKYTESGAEEIVPARISKSLTKMIQDLSIKVYKTIGCRGFGRVDFILKDEKEPVVLEINTIPGLTPMSLLPKAAQAKGISYPNLLDTIIDYAKNNK